MKVGDFVFYSSIIGNKPDTDQCYEITKIGEVCGSTVAWLKGKSGCVAIEALTPASKEWEPSFH